MIERGYTLRRTRQAEDREYKILREALRNGRAQLQQKVDAGEAPTAAAIGAGLQHNGAPEQRVREAIDQELEVQSAVLSRNLSILATIASTAPYIGLFGTVLGILMAFREIAATGQTGASVVAGGISEALTATAIGLGVAIPAVMAYNFFNHRVNDLILIVETHTLDIASRLPDLAPAGGGEVESR
jgi:biopolymer transport protein ExbB